MIARRKFLTGLIAAPLVVSYQNIMPVKLFTPNISQYDPVLIPIIRKNIMDKFAKDIISIQPMWNNPEIVDAVKVLTGRDYSYLRA